MRTHCPRGHEMTGDNVYMNKNDGIRRCRKCRRANDEAYRLRQNINREWKRHNTTAKPESELTRRSSSTSANRPPPDLIEDAKRRSLAPRSITSAFFGDPAPGFSQLDIKRREAGGASC